MQELFVAFDNFNLINMQINIFEIRKILTKLSEIDLNEDFEVKSLQAANEVSNDMLIALINSMKMNPEFNVDPKFVKHLEIFISVSRNRGL